MYRLGVAWVVGLAVVADTVILGAKAGRTLALAQGAHDGAHDGTGARAGAGAGASAEEGGTAHALFGGLLGLTINLIMT